MTKARDLSLAAKAPLASPVFTGKVGIGTSSPTSKIHATTATAGYTAKLINTNGASDANGLLIQAGTAASEYALNVANTAGNATFMAVKGNGRVSIGNSSPITKLHISGSVNNDRILIESPHSVGLVETGLEMRRSTTVAGAKIQTVRHPTLGGLGLDFYTTANGAAEDSGTYSKRVSIDSAGRVTMPYQPMCVVSRASDNGAGTVVWDYVRHNVGGHYNTSNGRFTAPIAGNYMVGFYVMSPANNVTMDVSMRLNGSGNNHLSPYSGATGGNYNAVSGYTIITLAANDYIHIHAATGIYGTNTGRHSNFTVALLS